MGGVTAAMSSPGLSLVCAPEGTERDLSGFYGDPITSGPTLLTSCNPNYFFRGPITKRMKNALSWAAFTPHSFVSWLVYLIHIHEASVDQVLGLRQGARSCPPRSTQHTQKKRENIT